MSAFIDFWLRGITPGDPPLDHRAVAESELADYLASIPPGGGQRPLIYVNADYDWLAPGIPPEWICDMLATLSRHPGCDFHLFTLEPEFWQQRLSAATALPLPGAEIARLWLDGRCPGNLVVGSVPAKQAIVSSIPRRKTPQPVTSP